MRYITFDLAAAQTPLERYARYCGPAVVASVLGISRLEAAQRLHNVRKTPNYRTTQMSTIGIVLGRPVERLETRFEDGDAGPRETQWYRGPGMQKVRRIPQPTLARWLRENPRVEAVLRLAHHFIHVRNGRIVEANQVVQRRARVTHVIRL